MTGNHFTTLLQLILILLCVILAGSMAVYLAQAGKKQKQEIPRKDIQAGTGLAAA